MSNPKLTIDLIPKSCWFTDIQTKLNPRQWDTIRTQVYKNADYKCEICFSVGDNWPVECHEVWFFDEKKQVQRLRRIMALCPNCRKVKNFKIANLRFADNKIIQHLCQVNEWDQPTVLNYLTDIFNKWLKQNEITEWKLDVTYLNRFGIQWIG